MENVLESNQYKFFKFVNRDSDATNVTFTVRSHHGDADLYVSKTEKYPNEEHFDRKSDLSSRFADEVVFSKDKKMKSIEGTYYIGVKAVEYTSYSIIASITRKGDARDDDDDVVGPREIVPFQLREGVTHNEFLSEKTKKYYKFKTTMKGEDIHDIRITLTASSGKYQYFVRSGKMPTKNNYDYASFDGSDIIMKKDDKKFKATGTKYIMVMPNPKLEKFPERGRFALKYTAGHTLQPIVKGIPVEGTVKLGDYDYFRYHSLDKDRDLVVSLTPHSGESNLVVSTDPENMYPTVKNNSFYSLKEGRDSIILKGRDLFKGIKTCNPIEAMRLGESPCEVYIGVHCDDSTRSGDKRKNDRCSFSLKIYSMRNTVHMLHSGVPQKDHVQKKQSMTYYMPLDAKKDDLYITTNAEHGGVKIYASFGDHKLKYSEINAPTKEEHVEAGREVGSSQMIHFKRDDIRKNCTDFIECMVIISVEGIGEGQDSGKEAVEKEKTNEFVITAYYHIRKLIPNAASFTEMEADTMAYFTYRSFCDECTIFLSAVPFSIEADIDMYLNIGAQKDLPTNQSYDIMRDEWFTEHIELDTNHEFYKAANIKDMQVIIIGIYARQSTLVDVYVEESKGKIQTLTLGKGIQMSQKEETKLFRYAHKGDSSIKFELVGLHGVLKIKANCYDPIRLEKSMNSYLPNDDNTPSWQMNTEEGVHALIIESTHEDFCPDGVYLLSVTAVGWKGSKYTLRVHTDKTFTFDQMKVGVPVKGMLSADQEKKYSFVLDTKKQFRIVSSVSSGGINFELSKTKDFKKVTHSSGTSNYIKIDEYDIKKDFKRGENLYIKVTGEKDYTEFVLVITHDDSYSIIPDGQIMTYTVDPTNPKGINLMYYPPTSAISMKIQVDGYDAGVAFVVNHKDEYLYQIKNGEVQFPAFNNEEISNTNYATEGKRYTDIIHHDTPRNDPFVWLFNIAPVIYDDDVIFQNRPKGKDKDEVQIAVQISVSEVNILAQNKVTEHIYRTQNVGEYTYFKFFASGNKDIEVGLTPCVCMTEMSIFKSMSDAQQDLNPQYRSFALVNGLKKIHIPDASGPYFVKVSKSLDPDFDKYRYDTVPCSFEIVYYEKNTPNYEFMIGNMYPENDGVIDYWWHSQRLKLLWGSIIKEDGDKIERTEAIGELYGFREKHVLMTSMCGFKKHLRTFEHPIYHDGNVHRVNQKRENYSVGILNLPEINREKYMTFYFLAHVNRKGGAILYKPLTVKIDGEWNSGIPWFLIFVVVLVLASLGYAAYYYKNMQRDGKRPGSGDYEMNDMREFSRVPAQDQYGL